MLKPGKLTKEEFEEMKTHTFIGKKALDMAESKLDKDFFLKYAVDIATYHHEKWDGTGYPMKLKGNKIPLAARLMAIADVYDPLTSKRVYKKKYPIRRLLKLFVQGKALTLILK